MKTLLILSGGADSATLAYYLKKGRGDDVMALSFDYGQRHRKELDAAARLAKALEIPQSTMTLPGLGALLKGSSLTDATIPVPHGHYEAETMRQTVVPNRNTIMLAIAWGVACANECDFVALGIHAGDHYIYPDCRPGYLEDIKRALLSGTEGHRKPSMDLVAPFLHFSKADIVKEGLALKVPYELTWTCYEGGDHPCGKCGSCGERAEAFAKSGATDPLV